MDRLYHLLPPEGVKIATILFLSFLMGLEREEHKGDTNHYAFGGVRTFPLIGLVAYAMAMLSGDQLIPLTIGFAVVAAFLLVSYRHKLSVSETAGVTSEIAGLTTYLIGALVYHEQYWIATTLTVASVLLLELKGGLESLTKKLPGTEILTFAKFLLLTVVVLPVLPNREMSRFQINPFKAWLVVAAVSTVSYGSYVIQKAVRRKGGVILAAVLGGAYSSTITTIVLGRRASRENRPHLFSGAILMASAMMYVRLAALVGLFNGELFTRLGPWFGGFALAAAASALIWARIPDRDAQEVEREFEPKNPLELSAALVFAGLFVLMLVATNLTITYLGKTGVYSLAGLMGITDVDPFIMGMTQSSGSGTPLSTASTAILIAAASNNVIKGIYAYVLCDRRTGVMSLVLLVLLAVVGLAPLLFSH